MTAAIHGRGMKINKKFCIEINWAVKIKREKSLHIKIQYNGLIDKSLAKKQKKTKKEEAKLK